MIVRIIRIVLTGVVFRNDGICCQIQEETSFLSNQSSDDLIQMILGNEDVYKRQVVGSKGRTPARSLL